MLGPGASSFNSLFTMTLSIRKLLDQMYWGASFLAAVCLVAILLVILLEMISRWMSIPFPGATEYAGYLMATASFLAFAHALNRGAHIRVSLLLHALRGRRRVAEIWCFAIGSSAACFLAYNACRLVYFSYLLHDFSQGQDETPMWIPQIPFALGAVLLAIAFIDNLLCLVFAGRDNIKIEPSNLKHIES